MLFLRSELLAQHGLRHGFSLRTGGVSQGPFASLNLSDAVGDDPRAVARNLELLREAADLPGPVVTARQVHGDRVLALRGGALVEILAPSQPANASSEQPMPGEPGDALLALAPGDTVGVRVADCVPVLIYDPRRKVGAAVHSGWRGTLLGVAARAVEALRQVAGADPGQMIAALGPAIGSCCYEVSEELASTFAQRFGSEVVVRQNDKPHLDLRLSIELTLRKAGLMPDRIEHVGECTACDTGTYYSHRKEKGRTGRHLAFLSV